MDWPLIVSIIVYLCGWAICLLCLLMIPRRRDPGSAQAWLLFIFLFPWLGLLMFLVLGSPKLPPHRRARQRQIDERLAQLIQRDEANPTLRPVFDHEVDTQRQPIAFTSTDRQCRCAHQQTEERNFHLHSPPTSFVAALSRAVTAVVGLCKSRTVPESATIAKSMSWRVAGISLFV